MSEPPLVIGRGLVVATGVFGTLLGLAVLWMLVPIGFDTPHRAQSAAPGVTRSDEVLPNPGAGSAPASASDVAAFAAEPVVTLPAERVPPNTLVLAADSPASAGGGVETDEPTRPEAVVVMVEGSSFMLTTAAAVTSDDEVVDEVAVSDTSDDLQLATVVAVTQGVAMLAPSDGSTAGLDVVGFDAIATADTGDTVTLLGPESVDVPYPAAGEALAVDMSAIDPDTLAEGTPLVDGDGALVALCTMSIGADGDVEVYVVPVAPLVDEATSSITVPTAPTDRSAWLGVQLVDDTEPADQAAPGSDGPGPEARGVLIATVMPDSPATAAGLRAGETILSIDDRSVVSIDDIIEVMATAVPGDTAVLVVAQLGADGSIVGTRVVSVVLAAAPSV